MTTLTKQRIAVGGLAVAYLVWVWRRLKKEQAAKDGVGKVIESDYYSARVTTTDGRKMVQFMMDGDGERIHVSAFQDSGNDRDYMGDWDYWFSIGTYTTLAGAKRAAVREMRKMGYELDPKDLARI